MDFFDSVPRPDPPEPQRRPAWDRPDDRTPVTLPLDHVLARTDRVAVFLGGVRVYPNGFELTVDVVYRTARRPVRRPSNPFRGGWPDGDDDALRLGVLYADGRRAIADQRPARPERPPMIRQRGGSGGAHGWEQRIWVWGIPEEGPVTLVCDWRAEDVPERRLDLDGDALRAAAARSAPLWPDGD